MRRRGFVSYIVELVTEDVDAFAVVVDDVETALHVSFWEPGNKKAE